MGYTKLFSEILDSTIWREPLHVKVVWITMMAMCDRDGEVRASVPGLADRARVDRSQCEQALAILMAPDPDSRTTDHEGRRIAKVDGGWRLINHAAYKRRMSPEERRERDAERKRVERAARRVTLVTSADVRGQSTMSGNVQEVSHADQIRSDADQTRSDPKRETQRAREVESVLTRNEPKPTPPPPHSTAAHLMADDMASEMCATFKRLTGRAWTSPADLLDALHGHGALVRSPMPDQVRAMVAHLSTEPEPIHAARRAMEAWAADPWVKANRFPMAHLAKDPLKYLTRPVSVSGVDSFEHASEEGPDFG